MPSFESLAARLIERLSSPGALRPQGADPLYYLIFPPEHMLGAKRHVPVLKARLENAGWRVTLLSMADVVDRSVREHPLWGFMQEQAELEPLDIEGQNRTVEDVLDGAGAVEAALLTAMTEASAGGSQGLLLVTDLEALHPYVRIRVFEERLVGKVPVPTVILYPGTRTGQFGLRFLGFYTEDHGYRSQFIETRA